MKLFKFYVVVFIVLVLSVSSLSFTGHHPSPKDQVELGQNLRDLKLIEVIINRPHLDIYKDLSDWGHLKKQIETKLKSAKLPVFIPVSISEPNVMRRLPRMEKLKINIGYFKPADSQKYFCRTQIVLSRWVRLIARRNPKGFFADVWKSESVIAMADEPNDIPQKAVEAALKLTNDFISDYKKANVKAKKFVEAKPVNIESHFVSSKNSKVFHHPDCASAKRIKSENITMFNSADSAIKAGLRPCKICGKQKL